MDAALSNQLFSSADLKAMFCMSLLTADFQHLHFGIENLMRLFQREGGFLHNSKCCVWTRSRLRCSAEVFGVKKTKFTRPPARWKTSKVEPLLLPFEGWPKAWCVQGDLTFSKWYSPHSETTGMLIIFILFSIYFFRSSCSFNGALQSSGGLERLLETTRH